MFIEQLDLSSTSSHSPSSFMTSFPCPAFLPPQDLTRYGIEPNPGMASKSKAGKRKKSPSPPRRMTRSRQAEVAASSPQQLQAKPAAAKPAATKPAASKLRNGKCTWKCTTCKKTFTWKRKQAASAAKRHSETHKEE